MPISERAKISSSTYPRVQHMCQVVNLRLCKDHSELDPRCKAGAYALEMTPYIEACPFFEKQKRQVSTSSLILYPSRRQAICLPWAMIGLIP